MKKTVRLIVVLIAVLMLATVALSACRDSGITTDTNATEGSTDPDATSDGEAESGDGAPEDSVPTDALNGDMTFSVTSSVREQINLNEGWTHHHGDVQADYKTVDFDDSTWQTVNIPHTWNVEDGEDGGDSYMRTTGWYRKRLTLPAEYEGKSVWLEFQGAANVTTLFVNGKIVDKHKGGYSTFRFDISENLIYGQENLIVVSVSNVHDSTVAPLSGDFTLFGGIYRNVNLIVCESVHLDMDNYGTGGFFVTQSEVSSAAAKLSVAATLVNEGATSREVQVRTTLRQPNGFTMTAYEKEFFGDLTLRFDPSSMGDGTVEWTETSTVHLPASGSYEYTIDTVLQNPRLWNGLNDPFRYVCTIEVLDAEGRVIDDVESYVGLRTFSVDKATGFYLNGESYPLHGVCKHQDRKGMGNAITASEMAEDMALIYEIGANAVRLSHYPHAPYVYELCDKYGIVVYTEIPFVNGYGGSGSYFNQSSTLRSFIKNIREQLTELTLQVYNRPSVAVIGLENEAQTADHSIMVPLLHELNDLVHSLDPSKYTAQATFTAAGELLAADLLCWNSYTTPTRLKKLMDERYALMTGQSVADISDRYEGRIIDKYLQAGYYDGMLDRPLGLSEYGAGGSIYQHTDSPETAPVRNEFQSEEYHAYCHENWAAQIKQMDYCWGTFVWNMFDFASDRRNEATEPGVNTKGLVTRDRQTRKDAFYIYKAHWSNESVLYINGVNNATRSTTPPYFKIYSNCTEVELFVDGRSLGKLNGSANALEHVFRWSFTEKLSWGEHEIKAEGLYNGETVETVMILTIVKNGSVTLYSDIFSVNNVDRIIQYASDMTVQYLMQALYGDGSITLTVKDQNGEEVRSGPIYPSYTVEVISENGENQAEYTFSDISILTDATATASGEQSDNPAKAVLDTDSGTRWATSIGSSGRAYVTLELAYPAVLDVLRLEWYGSGRIYYYTVEISLDGKNFTEVLDRTRNTRADCTEDKLGGVYAKYIRINVTGSSAANGWASIHELSLTGYRLSDVYAVDEETRTITVEASAVEQITKQEFIENLNIVGASSAEVTNATGTAYFINDGDTLTVHLGDKVYTYTIRFET